MSSDETNACGTGPGVTHYAGCQCHEAQHAAEVESLRARLAATEAQLAAAREEVGRMADKIDAFQDASGLCVPAEEKGGDPGGVEPRHVRTYIEHVEKERDDARRTARHAREEAGKLHSQLRTLRDRVAALRAVAEAAWAWLPECSACVVGICERSHRPLRDALAHPAVAALLAERGTGKDNTP